jgi:hypothetical protein
MHRFLIRACVLLSFRKVVYSRFGIFCFVEQMDFTHFNYCYMHSYGECLGKENEWNGHYIYIYIYIYIYVSQEVDEKLHKLMEEPVLTCKSVTIRCIHLSVVPYQVIRIMKPWGMMCVEHVTFWGGSEERMYSCSLKSLGKEIICEI